MKNKLATRTFSSEHEKQVAKLLGATLTPNSGAGLWKKGDLFIDNLMLIECKTVMQDKESFSIKKDWINKNKEEAFQDRLPNSCIAFNFGPGQESYFIIDSKLMVYLIEKLSEEIS